jgi:hypothetical protein
MAYTSFCSTKNLSSTPLRALATHILVIVAQNNLQSLSKTKIMSSFESRLLTRSSTQKLIPISHHGRYLQSNPCIGSKFLTIARDLKLKKTMKQSVYVSSLDVLFKFSMWKFAQEIVCYVMLDDIYRGNKKAFKTRQCLIEICTDA